MRGGAQRLLQGYYLGTPAFLLMDFAFGVNIRAAGFAALPGLRWMYYGLCLLCGLAIWRRRSWAGWVAYAESAINIVSLVIGFVAPYFALLGTLSQLDGNGGILPAAPFTPTVIANFALAGSAGLLGIYTRSIPGPR